MREIQQEITPVSKDDLFIVLDYEDAKFDYPIHCHSEYEINLVLDTDGTRVIGNYKEDFAGLDLIMVSPYIPHVWKSDKVHNHVVTVQFSNEMLKFPIMNKLQFRHIREFLDRAVPAVRFLVSNDSRIVSRLLDLKNHTGFDSGIEFLSLLNDLAVSEYTILSDSNMEMRSSKSRRISRVCAYTEENLSKHISISDVASLVNMSESAFSHFFKSHTRISYVSYLNNLRIAKACRLLEGTMLSVSEICYECGFNNKSNFNRIFLKSRGVTPTVYRKYINNILV
jgi:AraC-like DNA-binding protein